MKDLYNEYNEYEEMNKNDEEKLQFDTNAARTQIKINNVQIYAIVDTGAGQNIIGESLRKKLKLENLEPSKRRFTIANGKNIASKGIINTFIKINNNQIPIQLEVIDSTEEDVILGTKFMNQYNGNIDFDKEEITLYYQGEEIIQPIVYKRLIDNVNLIKEKPKYVLNILYCDDKIWISKRDKDLKVMPRLWQTVCGKTEQEDKNSKSACIRETQEETGIQLKENEPWFVFNDPEFNCDVYITKTQEIPRHTEPEKMSEWIQVDFKQYQYLAESELMTKTHNKEY